MLPRRRRVEVECSLLVGLGEGGWCRPRVVASCPCSRQISISLVCGLGCFLRFAPVWLFVTDADIWYNNIRSHFGESRAQQLHDTDFHSTRMIALVLPSG